jgi:hypothetical protein
MPIPLLCLLRTNISSPHLPGRKVDASGVAASGGSVDTLMMNQLSDPVNVDWRYLFGAGIIMVLALWFSKKAKSVKKQK